MDTEQLKREILAQLQLERAGSVLAREAPPRFAPGNPYIDPLLQTVGQLLNFGNPINWMSGFAGSAATIYPTSQGMVSLLNALKRRAPKLVSEAEQSAQQIAANLTSFEPMLGHPGVYQRVNNLGGLLKVSANQSKREQLRTLAHELKHALPASPPRPEHIVETTEQIAEMLPHQQQGEMLGYLSNLKRLRIYNEALSYLTEALLYPSRSADPALESVANALGHGIR